MQFTEALCLIQSCFQRRPLVIGKSSFGIYLLDKWKIKDLDAEDKHSPVVLACDNKHLYKWNAAAATPSFPVWHSRLGHMSCGKMNLVSRHVKFINNTKDFMCDICPRAKQHRLPFPTSHISSSKIFELLHVDTWGPYHTKNPVGHRYFFTIVDD